MAPELPASPFDVLIGTAWGEMSAERASLELAVADHHKQPTGLVHGGVYCTLAESLASHATNQQVVPDGNVGLAISNNTSFLRPIGAGTIHVEATRRHGGRTTWIWDVEHCDDEGRVCALSRVTVAVRPLPPGLAVD